MFFNNVWEHVAHSNICVQRYIQIKNFKNVLREKWGEKLKCVSTYSMSHRVVIRRNSCNEWWQRNTFYSIYTRTHLRFQPKITTENRIPVLLIGLNKFPLFKWNLDTGGRKILFTGRRQLITNWRENTKLTAKQRWAAFLPQPIRGNLLLIRGVQLLISSGDFWEKINPKKTHVSCTLQYFTNHEARRKVRNHYIYLEGGLIRLQSIDMLSSENHTCKPHGVPRGIVRGP